MVKKLLTIFIIIVGILIGPGVVYAVNTVYGSICGVTMVDVFDHWIIICIYIGSAVLTGLIFILSSNKIVDQITSSLKSVDNAAGKSSPAKITAGVIGLIIGLVIASLLSLIFSNIPSKWVAVPLMIITYIIVGALGWSLGYSGKFDISTVIGKYRKNDRKHGAVPKILDTSAIIDGRIYDIVKTDVFEGVLIVPGFVITELQHISDSADDLKRQKGRRGLDILHKMQQDFPDKIVVMDKNYEDVAEVDAKLVRLAIDQKGKIITLDYNLNKVARVYSVPVFNVNELANAVKPVLVVGEDVRVVISKDGKEANQGVAYLDDGTMIVVEGAKGKVGEEMTVTVTSVLQTSAGKMIFAKV